MERLLCYMSSAHMHCREDWIACLDPVSYTHLALDEAWTWEELAENAQKLNQDTDGDGNTDVWGCGVIGYVDGATTYTNFPLFFMLGGALIDENGMPAFNTEAAYGACDYYHDLIYKYEVCLLYTSRCV